MVGVLENRQSAQHAAGGEHHAADLPDDLLQAEAHGPHVVALGPLPLSEPDGHHLVNTALDAPIESRVPLDATAQHDTVRVPGFPIHRNGDALGRLADRHHIQRAHNGHSHRTLGDAIVCEHFALPFRRPAAVAAHDRNDEGLDPLIEPRVHNSFDDRVDVGDPATADSHRDATAGRDSGDPRRGSHFLANGTIDIRQRTIWETLADRNQSRQSHGKKL